MAVTTASIDSCSQKRRTSQPSFSQSLVVSASRAMFFSIFASQNSLLVFDQVRCWGQPCQKHPSIKTASLLRGKEMSEVRRMVATGRRLTKNRRPRRCNSRLTATSGPVSWPRFDRMLRRTPGEEAQEESSDTTRLYRGGSVQPCWKPRMDAMTDTLSLIDLFAGCGGMTVGFAREGFRSELAVEFDFAAAATYAQNFGESHTFFGDIADLPDEDIPEVDVVIGGPPCQGFSNLGSRDVDDPRNKLWKE